MGVEDSCLDSFYSSNETFAVDHRMGSYSVV